MIRIGLTGGIGAGKSTVAQTFIAHGAYHIDADKIAREVVARGTPGLAQLVEAFGEDVLTADGGLDRPALAAKAFVSDDSRKLLNSITHPLIGARTQELTDAAPDDAIVLHDVPLLVEGHMAPFYHLVVVVHADEDIRLRRLVELRGMDAADAEQRIAAQATDEQRHAVADIWLDNSGTPDELADAALAVWERRIVPFRDNVSARRDVEPSIDDTTADPEWTALGARLVNRVWALVGGAAQAVEHCGTSSAAGNPARPIPELTVTVADLVAAEALTEPLAAGGFPPVESDDPHVRPHGSADPGRGARVSVRPAE
ncbi:dephospho-CoA kinase [Gordonia sp. (in: high G+C Gram-positive bacteria)]|uniref:dephospho-CoA kinase n=1 Tax=Gordonia sp. (in: high G+C Gram-positive bacteria) TaxID=84139 RepID=UPI003F995100